MNDDADPVKPSDFDDPNGYYVKMFYENVDRVVAKGVDSDTAMAGVFNAMHEAAQRSATPHADSLVEFGTNYVRESSDYREGFEERLREHWGQPLDLFEIIVSIVQEASEKFATRNFGQTGAQDLLVDVLQQLTGQAIRVAREVHTLLRTGYPLGALSLARTIHEVAVRAYVLSTFGVEKEHKDLAERFVLHDHVDNYRDAVIYQEEAEESGHEPIAGEALAQMKRNRDELIERFGISYKTPFGWASGLPGLPKEPKFVDLERVSGLGHLRGYYRWSSHLVHGDSKGMRLSRLKRGGRDAVLIGPTNVMLADPGQQALRSLNRVFVYLVTAVEPMAFYDDLICASLAVLLDRADHLFVDGERSVDAEEERLQAELADRGLRFDPVLGEVPLGDDLTPEADA